MKDITKFYEKDNFTVIWKPAKCIHAGECTKALPEVYKPKERPWVNVDNATIQELKDQINLCPSGALSFYHDENLGADSDNTEVKVQIFENGPALVYGKFDITKIDGSVETQEGRTALCRCGASGNKPFCDGSHSKIDFKG